MAPVTAMCLGICQGFHLDPQSYCCELRVSKCDWCLVHPSGALVSDAQCTCTPNALRCLMCPAGQVRTAHSCLYSCLLIIAR